MIADPAPPSKSTIWSRKRRLLFAGSENARGSYSGPDTRARSAYGLSAYNADTESARLCQRRAVAGQPQLDDAVRSSKPLRTAVQHPAGTTCIPMPTTPMSLSDRRVRPADGTKSRESGLMPAGAVRKGGEVADCLRGRRRPRPRPSGDADNFHDEGVSLSLPSLYSASIGLASRSLVTEIADVVCHVDQRLCR